MGMVEEETDIEEESAQQEMSNSDNINLLNQNVRNSLSPLWSFSAELQTAQFMTDF
jgi:hypothetical protein